MIANIFAQRFGNPVFGGQWPTHQPMPPVQMPFQQAPMSMMRPAMGQFNGVQPPMQQPMYQQPVNALRMRYGMQ